MKFFVMIAALVLAAPSFAQTNVTVYGVVDAFGLVQDGQSRIARVQSGGLAGSRVGFRGTEDLGGGLRAHFTLEAGLNLDDGTVGQGGALWGRQAFVGLETPYGMVSLGRQYSSLYNLSSDFSIFRNLPVGPSTTVIGGFGGGYEPIRGAAANAEPPAAGATGNSGPARVNNSIRYETPAWNGVKASVLFGAGEVSGQTEDARLVDVGVRYTEGPFDVMLSHVDDRAVGVRPTHARITTVGAAYAFSPFRVVAGYLDFKDKGPTNQDGRGYWIGADYRIQSHLLKLQFVQNRPRYGADNRTNALGVGYEYELSKRTALYSSLTRFDNDGMAGGGLGRTSQAIPAGVTRAGDNSVNELVWGIRHSF